jgi:uncharacterized membrane protein HdeD (DUF308 family)
MNEIQVLAVRIPQDMIQHWAWFLALGIGLLLLGLAAVVRSVKATVVSMLFFGWLLVLAAGIEVAQVLLVGKWAGSFLHLVAAVLFLVTGILILKKPVIGAEVVTIFMAMFFLIAGLFQLVASLALQEPDWGWQALNGIITLVLGILVLAQWPASGLWVIGFFVGIDLIFRGWAWVALALDLRKM